MLEYFIPYNTPSSKNNKKLRRGYNKDGTHDPKGDRLDYSDYTQAWKKKTVGYFLMYKVEFRKEIAKLKPPYYIEFTFVRKDRGRADYHNLVQVVADCMTKAQWIPDDDMDNLKVYFGDYEIDKEKPGVRIKILTTKPVH